MKKFMSLLILAGALMSTSQANALAIWRGMVKVESTTSQCDNGFTFFAAGEEKVLFFLPAGVTDNGLDTVISVGNSAYFASMKIVGGALSSGAPYSTTALDPFGNLIRRNGVFVVGNVYPASFTVADKILTVVMRFSNAGGTPGCTVTLRGKLLKNVVN